MILSMAYYILTNPIEFLKSQFGNDTDVVYAQNLQNEYGYFGDGAIIGAGAVVSKDIPPYAVAVGCPIQIMRYRFTEEQREELLKIKWWLLSEQQLKLVEQYDDDIDGFIKIMKEKCS